MPHMDVSVHTYPSGERTVVEVGGEIDVYTAPVLRERLAALHESGTRHLVVDLRAVRFMDSTGLGVLVGVLKRVRLSGGSLILVIDSERGLDAVVLAAAGLARLGLENEIGHRFAPDELVPEAGQGAVALQVRAGDEAVVAGADDAVTRRRVEAERPCVAQLGAGCLAPVAAHHDGRLLTGLIAADDGSWLERRTGHDPIEVARALAEAADRRAGGATLRGER